MSPTPQRVILVTTDHMRYDGVAAYGEPALHTPTLDRLAAHGVNFHHCYCQSPICMPSRASFMTGLYPQQTGMTDNGYTIPDDFEPVMSRAFAAGGYQTAQIGKLHLQPHEDMDLEARPRNRYGFDVFMPSDDPGGYADAWMTWLSMEHPQHREKFHLPRPNSSRRMDCERGGGRVVDAPLEASASGWITDTALRYLLAYGARTRSRQFMHLGYYYPHPPFAPTREAFSHYDGKAIPPRRAFEEEMADKPRAIQNMMRSRLDWTEEEFTEYRRYFYACTTEVDLALARLVRELEEQGLLDDTLIVFTSDHGDMCGDHGMTHKGPSFYEQVVRVPLILHWPAGLGTQRRDVHGLVELVDLLPTLLDLSGAHVPATMMGRSYAAGLRDGSDLPTRDTVFAQQDQAAMLRTATHKYIRYNATGEEVLYDLQADPDERRNVAADSRQARALAALRLAMLERALAIGRSPRPKRHLF